MKFKTPSTGPTRRTWTILFALSISIFLVAAISFAYLYLQADYQRSDLKNQNDALMKRIEDFEKKTRSNQNFEQAFTSLEEQQKAFIAQLDVCATTINQLKNKGVIK